MARQVQRPGVAKLAEPKLASVLTITGAFVVFPALGLWLMNGGGGPVAVFATSFAVTAVAIPIALMMRRRELADRRAAPPEPETAAAPASASAIMARWRMPPEN